MSEISITILVKFIKFIVVGVNGMIVDFTATYFVKDKLQWNKYIANTIGFFMGATNVYFINRVLTFESNNQDVFIEYSKFISIYAIGLIINNLVVYLVHGKLNIKFYIAKLIAIGITAFWNFFANYYFTFN
ncbi:GtrA family protein [Thermoflexibacter ruber]|uniref:Putative flippase GtrA (Transmembrane translocase of bactoprenol-linked glucose) n=1 Tax=Thermoflexibacter ruber TaxID=1003 RepID=A0A1I2FT23_9BACT|nr:GtrA family protein [Thermoflexibacter ruber]SFF08465.1 Putative flippase GtrA (transmembrane translocase of bactoprenol-linked glucose) [Thermoflexibacter ruber]